MPNHGRVRLAPGHNMMFMSTYSIPLGGEKDTYSWVVSNNEGPSILENRTEDYVHAFPWL